MQMERPLDVDKSDQPLHRPQSAGRRQSRRQRVSPEVLRSQAHRSRRGHRSHRLKWHWKGSAGNGNRPIPCRPIQALACFERHLAVLDAHLDAVAIKLDLVDPTLGRWRPFQRLAKLRRNEQSKVDEGTPSLDLVAALHRRLPCMGSLLVAVRLADMGVKPGRRMFPEPRTDT